ncbi:MAG: hypothetical protein M3P45_16175 [Acidobacteriota bacterium]|nr:hypothetical protein [Acidobacteriota bacterium]
MKQQPATHENAVIRILLIVAMILFAAVIRIVPHPWNLAPVGALALFSGAAIRSRAVACLFPLLALLAGDFFVGFHVLMPVVYGSFVISIGIGMLLRNKRTILRLGGAVLLGALQFFVITNFGVWAFLNSYPKTLAGLGPVTLPDYLFSGIRWQGMRFFRGCFLGHCFWRNALIRWQ